MTRRLWALLLAGCASAPAPQPGPDGVRLEVLSVAPDNPVEGDAVTLRYLIVNASDELLIFGAGRSRYGSLKREGETVIHDTMAQQATPPVFYERAQFILPRSSVERTVTVDVLDPRIKLTPPLSAFDPKSFEAWIPFGVEMSRPCRRVGADRLGLASEVIVFGSGRTLGASAAVEVRLQARAWPLAEAKKAFDEAPDSVRWSKALGGWVLASAGRTALVKREGTVELPAGAFSILSDFESGCETFPFRLAEPERTELVRMFQTREGDGMYRRGTFIEVPRERLMEVLEHAREEKLEARQVYCFLSSYYYELRSR